MTQRLPSQTAYTRKKIMAFDKVALVPNSEVAVQSTTFGDNVLCTDNNCRRRMFISSHDSFVMR